MTFASPLWLWALAVLPLLALFLVVGERSRAAVIDKLVAARLQPRLAGSVSATKRRLRFFLALLALALAILALARPQWGFAWEEAKRKGRDVLITIDASRSMLADDVKPNRLTRAKLAAEDLLDSLTGDRVGIVVFAGTAFLQAPLTVDYSAIRNSLKEIDTETIPQGGTNLKEAMLEAKEAFGKGESDNRALIVFSDGEELEADAASIASDFKGKVKIFTVGIGTPEGALIPIRKNGRLEFVQDETGNPVRSRLDEKRLRNVAEDTGGFYLHLQAGRAQMQDIVRRGLGSMTEQEIDARMSQRPTERYQWPLGGAIVALFAAMLLGERRRTTLRPGLAAVLCLAFCLPLHSARADETKPTAEDAQKAAAKAEYDQFQKQLKWLPDSPEVYYNLGTAAYKKGDIDEAMRNFSRGLLSLRRDVQVNSRDYLGNSLYQTGRKKEEKKDKLADWKEAVQQYDEALKLEPGDKRVTGHREFVLRKIQELEPEQKQSDQQQQDQKQQDQKDQKNDQKDQKQQQQQKSGGQSSKDQKSQSSQQQKGQQDQSKDSGSKDQKSEKQDGQQGDEQKEGQKDGSKSDEKGEQKDGAKADEKGEKKDGSKSDEKGEQKDGAKPDEKGEKKDDSKSGEKGDEQKPGDPQSGENKKGDKNESGKNQTGQKSDRNEKNPPPTSSMHAESGPKKEGELKGLDANQSTKAEREAAEQADNVQAAAERRMTPQQARDLFESNRNEDAQIPVRPITPRNSKAPLKDW